MMTNRRLVLPCVISLLTFNAVQAESDNLYDVGVAVVDITPEYPIRLNGFGNRREESEGVSQPIFARALAVSQGDQPPLVLVTLDSLGIRLPMVDQVADRLRTSHQLPRQNLAVTFSHSHCTPKVNGACDNIFSTAIPPEHQVHIDQYTKELTDHITTAARKALDDRRPARLEWAVGTVGFAKNRRMVGGPVDHDLPMLVVRDADTDEPRAIYVSYACHCVTLSFNQVNGDWAGYAAAMIERQLPEVVAMVSIGAGSDQNPVSGVTGDQVAVAEAQGVEIATEVVRLLQGPLRKISGPPKSVLNKIDLPLNELPTRDELMARTTTGRPTDRYNATTQLARLDRGESLLSEIEYPIQTWTFGDSFCMTFLAGEVCVDYALRLKSEMDRERFWLNTYSNDFCCYIPSERLVVEGGYGGGAEVPYFALPTTLKAGLEQRIIDEVHRQVPAAFHVPDGTQGVPPKKPEESRQCMVTAENLQVLLAAAEPQLSDPVAIDFGADGRLWVAEMNDYGRGVYETFEQHGRVRWLHDDNGDGFFESATTFVEGLRFPTDVKVWRDGVLICDAPDILYARDTDQDGAADSITTLFTGFEVRNAQARVNSLQWGLDNRIYGAGGLFGGVITCTGSGTVVDCSNRDFRIDPDAGTIEPVTGRTQQGRVRNDWGDWFGCSNGALLRAIPANDDGDGRHSAAMPSSPPGLTADAEAFRLYPPENLVTFELSGAPGRATSACGLGIYRDSRLGADYFGDAFTCEPVHQSVHRIDLSDRIDGPLTASEYGYTGRRGAGEEMREFLSSTDRWFRPVQARTGPDGALWVVDMYRYVIEHSRWIPQETLAELNVYAGQGRGRIYRIVPRAAAENSSESPSVPLIPDLTALDSAALVEKLTSDNGTIRDLAHQLLLWREAETIVPDLRRLIRSETTPMGTVHGMSVLKGLDALQPADVLAVLQKSAHPEVLRLAVAHSEAFLSESAELQSAVLTLADHDHVRLRRQVALSLRAATSGQRPAVVKTLAKQLSQAEPDVHVRSAALSSVTAASVASVLSHYRQLPTKEQNAGILSRLLVVATAIGDASTIQTALSGLPDVSPLTPGPPLDLWISLLDALDQREIDETAAVKPAARQQIRQLYQAAVDSLVAERSDNAAVLAALKLLSRRAGPFTRSAFDEAALLAYSGRAQMMAEFLSPKHATEVQLAALQSLMSVPTVEAAELLIAGSVSLTGDVRAAALDALLGHKFGPAALLTALESGAIRSATLDASHRDRLLSSKDSDVRTAAERIFDAAGMSDRAAVVQTFESALQLPGDVGQGREVFRKRCSSCHRLEDHGHVVGPDLKALTNRDPRWLLSAILDPNKDVDARYIAWTAVKDDGRTASGLIVEESARTITLRESGGKEHVIGRDELEEFHSSQRSVMPEGLERDMSAQDFRDVIAYLDSVEIPAKKLPGNQPQVVTPDERGFLSLTATAAEIRGREITFETPFANIGYWHDENDSAAWRIELAKPAAFDIYVNAACAGPAAGNQFRIDGLPEAVRGTVASTGGWDRYRQRKVGTTKLSAGTYVVTVRSEGPVKQALFDLREVRLVPVGAAPMFAASDLNDTPLPRYPAEIAPFLLDESQSVERRQKVIDQRPGMGPAIISLLVADLKPGDTDEEYRRIPWIWRVAMAVARRNDGGEIRDVLEVCVPGADQPLKDWQAVVIGGGLINGAAQLGLWPHDRLAEILEGLPAVKAAWPRTLQLASVMADDERVKSGTRYDALRMVALLPADVAVPQLQRFLGKEISAELQMGAVSGLGDVPTQKSTELLAEALSWLSGRNRTLALEAMFRTDERAAALNHLVKTGQLTLTAAETEGLRQHPVAAVRQRVGAMIGQD
ncbi:MAG: neutral/alkaline non-lysosomal ceramidase N-terminal domain-containing protein [Fuerstiella sp.]